jgi:integrase
MTMRKKLTKRSVEALKPAKVFYEVIDDETPGFMVRVAPSGRKDFYVYYRIRGQRRRPALGTYHPQTFKVETAREKAQEHLAQAKLGRDLSAERQAERQSDSFAEFAERYMDDAKARVGRRTWEENRRRLDLHLIPALGKKRLTAINRNDVARLHQRLAEKREVERRGKRRGGDPARDGKSYERTTGGRTLANKSLALLKAMFATAERWGTVPEGTNPCRHVRLFKEKPRERYLTPDELARLSEALAAVEADRSSSPWALAAIRLLIFTGARRDEILGLRWEHVDAEARCLRLPESKTGPKVVHLNAPALEILTRLAEIRTAGNPYVIQGHKQGERLVNLTKPWYRVRERAGLPDLRLHDLRHIYAGTGAALGLGLPVVGKLLGHTQPRTTHRYANLAPDPVQTAAEAIGAALLEAMDRGRATVVEIAATEPHKIRTTTDS